jgi:hypothetical protein
VIEAELKAFEILRRPAPIRRISSSGVMPLGLGLQHDRRTVRVVGADEVHRAALHALEAHPDVGLDVLHDVADVERSVRERQCGRDERGTQENSWPRMIADSASTAIRPSR